MHTNLYTTAYFIMKVLYEYKLVFEIYKSNQNACKLHIWVYRLTSRIIKPMNSFSIQITIISIWRPGGKEGAESRRGCAQNQTGGAGSPRHPTQALME